MRIALDLFATALDLQRQNLRRRYPAATESEIDDLLEKWLHERPGAEHGDGAGRPGSRFAHST